MAIIRAEIYTKNPCPYCVTAKQLLTNNNIEYTEISAVDNLDELIKRVQDAGYPRPQKVPQIFMIHDDMSDEYIGGCDNLQEWLKNRE